MARNNNNDGSRVERDDDEKTKSVMTSPRDHLTPGERVMDPVRCAMCSSILYCPRTKDYDEWMVKTNLKCLDSDTPSCVSAVKNTRNKSYIARITSTGKS